ncbi:MAG: J domain-containing protein [Acidimicrobiales bacterium]
MGSGTGHNGGFDAADRSLYDLLEVTPDADLQELRSAYRRLARVFHPDVVRPPVGAPTGADGDPQLVMARINEAWSVLSDAERRAAYDLARRQQAGAVTPAGGAPGRFDGRTAGGHGRGPVTFVRPAAPDGRREVVVLTRKEAWLRGVGLRIRFLASYAGRSAVQTMLLRHPGTSRESWELLVPMICDRLTDDVGDRVRQARVAGAAPLDLANAATLLALHAYGAELLRASLVVAEARPLPWRTLTDADLRCHAEMVDRIYEALAYELPRELVHQLGNAPRVLRRLPRR